MTHLPNDQNGVELPNHQVFSNSSLSSPLREQKGETFQPAIPVPLRSGVRLPRWL